jgi:NitT/TauT family transport system substrate-binding protein
MLQLIDQFYLQGKVKVVEMNPPDMASALASGALDAYYVGEPFAAQTLKSGDAKLLYHVEDLWQNFICNLALVKQSLIDADPKAVALLVQGAARSGLWASQNPLEAAKIASMYWNQPRDLVAYALTTPPDRIVYDRFIPDDTEMQHLADLMQQYNLLQTSTAEGLVENRFAADVDTKGISDILSILPANQ